MILQASNELYMYSKCYQTYTVTSIHNVNVTSCNSIKLSTCST